MSSLNATEIQALLDGPSLPPPQGVTSQLDNPPNYRTGFDAGLIICTAVASLAFLLRLSTKVFILREFRRSDYAILTGFLLYISYFGVVWVDGAIAPGVHMWDLRLRDFESYLYYGHIASVIYCVSVFFVKLSILLQYMELFVPAKKANKTYWVCQGLIWFNLAFYLALTLVEIFACQPFNKIWDPLVTDGWCVNYISLEFYASLINTISDLVIFVLPQLVIWRLHMSLRRKVALSSLFVIGVVAVTASIVRLAYTIILFTSTDTSYYFHFAGTWSIPEVALGIVVACLPMLPKFFQSMNQGSIVTRLGYSIRSLMGKSSSGSRGTTEAIPMQDESDSPSNHRGTRRYQRYPDDTIRTSTLSENNPGDTEKIAPLDSVATGK